MVAVSEERLGAIRTVQAFNAVDSTETKTFKNKVDKIFSLAKTEAWASGELRALYTWRTASDHWRLPFAQDYSLEALASLET